MLYFLLSEKIVSKHSRISFKPRSSYNYNYNFRTSLWKVYDAQVTVKASVPLFKKKLSEFSDRFLLTKVSLK